VADVVAIPSKRATPRPKLVHQFLIVLSGTAPLVWRRIQVPGRYSFRDLHVLRRHVRRVDAPCFESRLSPALPGSSSSM
jgi:hypothetical protein